MNHVPTDSHAADRLSFRPPRAPRRRRRPRAARCNLCLRFCVSCCAIPHPPCRPHRSCSGLNGERERERWATLRLSSARRPQTPLRSSRSCSSSRCRCPRVTPRGPRHPSPPLLRASLCAVRTAMRRVCPNLAILRRNGPVDGATCTLHDALQYACLFNSNIARFLPAPPTLNAGRSSAASLAATLVQDAEREAEKMMPQRVVDSAVCELCRVDEATFASGSAHGAIALWDAGTGRLLRIVRGLRFFCVLQVSLTPLHFSTPFSRS